MFDAQAALSYLAPLRYSFWQWEEEGAVVAWRNGPTISFEPELRALLGQLAPVGLPPFEAILLLLSVCRDEGTTHQHSPFGGLVVVLRELAPGDYEVLLDMVLEQLLMVHEVWDTVKTEPLARLALCQAIFSTPGLPRVDQPQTLVQALETRAAAIKTPIDDVIECRKRLLAALDCLYQALADVGGDALLLRLRTGLDALIQAVPIETPPPQGSTHDLLRELETDEDLLGLARLSRQVLASLNLPRNLSDPDDLPDGGLSDITNRGPLDRLLLSELAYDDLTLAVRVSLREALYLRREAPPRTPPRQRAILIDCGLRLWGVPRLFATAVGMAIATGSENDFDIQVFRSSPEGIAPVDFTSRAGLLQHLAALDHHSHPAVALQQLAACLQKRSSLEEVVLVTEAAVLEDREFQQTLTNLAMPSLYVATVDREGEYRLVARSLRGSRLLREAHFELEDVLSAPAKQTGELLATPRSDEVPAILRIRPFPLRLAVGLHPERAWHAPGLGVLALTKDGRLMHSDRAGWGPLQLGENMPSGQVYWYTVLGTHHFAVVGRQKRQGLFVVDIDAADLFGPAVRRLELTVDKPLAVDGHAGVCFVFYPNYAEAFDVSSATRLGGLCIPQGFQRQRGRFFTKANAPGSYRQWYALAYGPDGLVFTEAVDERLQMRRAIGLIDAEKIGPLCVYSDGSLHSISTSHSTKPIDDRLEAELVATSRDRQWVVLRSQSRTFAGLHEVEVATGRHQRSSSKAHTYLEPELSRYSSSQSARHKFHAITLDGKRRLTLVTRQGERFPLQLSSDLQSILLPRKADPKAELETTSVMVLPGSKEHTFTPQAVIPFVHEDDSNSHYDLRCARWPDGSTAVLDARGMLHLRSEDSKIPEFSVVLMPGATAGWVADGRRWGAPLFHGQYPAETKAKAIYEELFQAFVGRLP